MRGVIGKLFSPAVLAASVLLMLIVYILLQLTEERRPLEAEVRAGRAYVSADSPSRLVLRGEWRFYWRQLLEPGALHDNCQLAWLPARWHDPEHGTGELPGNGYATYAVDIHFEQAPDHLGMRLPTLYRAAKVWANGELLLAVGEPADNPDEEIPRDEIKLVQLAPDIGQDLQLVLQISSFNHVDGGLHHPIILDDWNTLVREEKWRVLRGIFLMSSTLTLAIYLLVMWGYAHAGREYLYLGLGLFWYSVRIFGTEKLIFYIFPDFSPLWLLRAEYYGLFLCIPAYMLFIQALYPRDIHYGLIRAFWWAGVTSSVWTTLVEASQFTRLRDPYEVLCVLYILYFIGCLILIVWRRRPWSGVVSFLGGIIALLFVNEVLYYRQVTSVHLTPWVYVFVALTSIIFLGQRLNQLLSIESEQKALLQKAVDNRTFELQRRLEELDQARRHALELAQKRSEFMAELSHEIRTPLSGLVGAMRLIGRDGQCNQSLVRHAIDAGESLLAVVRESLSASGAGQTQSGRKSHFNLVSLLRSVTDIMAVVAREKELTLSLELDEGLGAELWFNGSALKIRQIVSNLLANAIKFTPHGGVTLSARITHIGEEGAEIDIAVTDTGIGIDVSQQARIFDEYVRLNPDDDNPGNGLGLSITRKLVKDLGGDIRVESALNEGSTFTVSLTLQVVEISGEAEGEKRSPAYTTRRPLNVLVVEDDRVNRAIVIQLLKSEGHKIQATPHPVEALKWLQKEHYQLCLYDIRLPDMSGLELIERSKPLVQTETTIFVALTANTSDSDLAQYRHAGFDFVIEKPVDKEHLQFVLARADRGKKSSDSFFLQNTALADKTVDLLVDRRLWQGIVKDLGRARAEALLEDAYHSLREYRRALEAALGRGNFPDIREYAHKIKSAAKSVGMINVANIAHHVESDPMRAFSVLANFDNLIERSYEQMRLDD